MRREHLQDRVLTGSLPSLPKAPMCRAIGSSILTFLFTINRRGRVGCWIRLREVGKSQVLLIRTGPFEVWALRYTLQNGNAVGRSTHRTIVDVIIAMGGNILSISVEQYDARHETFFCKLDVLQNDLRKAIDIRPSDAIVVAVVEKPLLVREAVI